MDFEGTLGSRSVEVGRHNLLMPLSEEVFISYAHDTAENAEQVLKLSNASEAKASIAF